MIATYVIYTVTNNRIKPYDLLENDEKPEAVIFPVKPDQSSGLVKPANYDRLIQDNVRVEFGAGCAQAISYDRFIEMEANLEESFLTKETWRHIEKRL